MSRFHPSLSGLLLLGFWLASPLPAQDDRRFSDPAVEGTDPFSQRGPINPIDVSKIRHSRITTGFRYDASGSLIGFDRDVPGDRFRPFRRSAYPGIESYFPESYFRNNRPAPPEEINRPLVGDSAGLQFTPLRRPVSFYERPDVNATEPPTVSSGRTVAGSPGEQRWFREPGPIRQGVRPIVPSSTDRNPVGAALPLSSADALPPLHESPPSGTAPTVISPDQTRRLKRQYEERLEAGLIGHASIHALSPIQVAVSGTTATVRGVVADRQSRIAVGRQLLTDPNIKQVNNLTTVLSDDPAARPEPVELK